MRTYSIDSDLNDEKRWYLAAVLLVTGWIAFAVLVPILIGLVTASPIPWTFTLIVLGVCEIARRRQHITLASWLYMAGVIALATLFLLEQGPLGSIYLLFLIPVALSGLLLESSISTVTTLAIIAMFGATLTHEPFVSTLGHVVVPSAVAIGLAVIAHVLSHNNLGLLH
jgi:hypothetical protein